MLGGSKADNEKGQRTVYLKSFRSVRGEGKGEVLPGGLGSKAHTSKSLHMGNLSGRGTS